MSPDPGRATCIRIQVDTCRRNADLFRAKRFRLKMHKGTFPESYPCASSRGKDRCGILPIADTIKIHVDGDKGYSGYNMTYILV